MVGDTVTGTVRLGTSTAKPQGGIFIDVLPTSPNASPGFAITTPNGRYTVTGLPSGSYHAVFGDPTCPFNTSFAPQWYNGKPSQSTADAFTVTAGATTSGIGATLLPGG